MLKPAPEIERKKDTERAAGAELTAATRWLLSDILKQVR
jgi:hypothetical protein